MLSKGSAVESLRVLTCFKDHFISMKCSSWSVAFQLWWLYATFPQIKWLDCHCVSTCIWHNQCFNWYLSAGFLIAAGKTNRSNSLWVMSENKDNSWKRLIFQYCVFSSDWKRCELPWTMDSKRNGFLSFWHLVA